MHLQQNNTIIKLEDVVVGYDRNIILPGVNFVVDEGDFVAITGPNGGGKTSLLRVILRLIQPQKGHVRFYKNGVEVSSLNVGYLPQKNAIDQRFPITVEETIASGLLRNNTLWGNSMTDIDREKVGKVLDVVGMAGYRKHAIGNLSGGQLQRVLFARSIVSDPSVLVLDEPLSYIDKAFESQFYNIMEQLSKHTTIVLVSHEMSRIMQMANRHIIVDRGIEDCHAHRHFVPADCE